MIGARHRMRSARPAPAAPSGAGPIAASAGTTPAGTTPACPYRPARDRLGDEARRTYDIIAEGLREHRARIELPGAQARSGSESRPGPRPGLAGTSETEELTQLVDDILCEAPDLWCERAHVRRTQLGGIGGKGGITLARTLVPTYPEGAAEATDLRRRMRMRAAEALAACAAPSDHGRALRLHDWLATRVTYQAGAPYEHDAPGALVDGAAVCDGIAKAYKYLCDAAGIPCAVMRGLGADQGGPHAWNVVYTAGRWTHVDVTADLPRKEAADEARNRAPSQASGAPTGLIPSRAFFGLSDAEILASSIPDPDVPYPGCPRGLGFFASFGLLARSESELVPILERELARGATHFEVELAPAGPNSLDTARHALEQVMRSRGLTASFILSQRRPGVVSVALASD